MIFLESPWPILLIGIAAEAVLAVMLIRTGRGMLLAVMAAVAVVVGIGLVVEQLVVTDRKLVAATIYGAAEALQENDRAKLESFLAPDATKCREEADRAAREGEFVRVTIGSLEVTVVRTTSPPTAKATFRVFAAGSIRGADFGTRSLPSFRMLVRLRLEGGRWLIVDHEFLDDPRHI